MLLADIFHKVNCQRIGRNIYLLELLQQIVQRTGILRRADQFVVYIQRVAVGDLSQLVGQLLFKIRRFGDIAPADKGGGIMNSLVGNGIGLAKRFGRDALELGRNLLGGCRAADGIDHAAVVFHDRSQRKEREKQRDRAEHRCAADEIQRVETARMPAVLALAAGADVEAAQSLQSFVQQ